MPDKPITLRPPYPGEVYGRWTIIGEAPKSKAGQRRVLCRCACGTEKIVQAQSIIDGASRSCECGRLEVVTKHGMSSRSEYRIWAGMRARCSRPSNPLYKNYGARGIAVCERWNSFLAFLADMGPRPTSAHSIDRIDNDGNYEPGNCRWATAIEQIHNQRPRRKRTHCRNGHRFTVETTAFKSGFRRCLVCRRLEEQRRNARLCDHGK